ncbi:MAG: flagellar hook-associated protein FlgK [Methylocystis sp.]|nr:flagellar hook-associated protein FlgK [Methylocystis sp.]
MNLSSAGGIANQSLGTVASQINVVSRNIAGINVPGYAAKTALLSTSSNGAAQIEGVIRATNLTLFQNSLQATSAQAASSALSDGLDQINQSMNVAAGSASDTTASQSPASLISALSNALQQYSASPSDTTLAQSALASAKALAQSLNNTTGAVQEVRRQADSDIASSVANINSILDQFQQINADIIAGSQAGRDITDSLDKRDALLSKLSQEIGITTVTRANNDMVIYADGGATLFETTPRNVSFKPTNTFTAATIGNAVYVDGVQITGSFNASMTIRSGKLQGLTQLRDVLAPQYQSQLDETARGLVADFAETDQTNPSSSPQPGLFTYPGATSAPGASVIAGLAGEITVNANVDPSQGGNINLLRDGGISNPGNPAYTYNTTGAAGYSTRIRQLIAALTTAQTFDASAGLAPQQSMTSYATSSIGWLEAQRQQAHHSATYQTALLSQTSQALSNATGVNLDEQMSKMLDLENSYQASARLISAINAMYDVFFQALSI